MSASVAADQVEPLKAVLCYADGRTRIVPVFTPAPVAIIEHADPEFAPAQGQRRFGFAGAGPQNLLRYAETEVIEATFRCGRCACCPPLAYVPRPVASNRLSRVLPSDFAGPAWLLCFSCDFAGPAWLLCFSCYAVSLRELQREREKSWAHALGADWRGRTHAAGARATAHTGTAPRAPIRTTLVDAAPRRSHGETSKDAYPRIARSCASSGELSLTLVPAVEQSACRERAASAPRPRAAEEFPPSVREGWVPTIQAVLREVDPDGLLKERDIPAAYSDQALVLSWNIEGPADLTLDQLAVGARRAFGRESDTSAELSEAYVRVAERLLSALSVPAQQP